MADRSSHVKHVPMWPIGLDACDKQACVNVADRSSDHVEGSGIINYFQRAYFYFDSLQKVPGPKFLSLLTLNPPIMDHFG